MLKLNRSKQSNAVEIKGTILLKLNGSKQFNTVEIKGTMLLKLKGSKQINGNDNKFPTKLIRGSAIREGK